MSTLKVDGIRSNSATSDAITLASDGTCTANITNNLSNRNLIINGAMQVAQRGTSNTTSGYGTVDRFKMNYGNTDESPTQAQVDVASGTTPYSLGFRKAFRVTNGNQSSGAGAGDSVQLQTRIEAQNIANSGWNYTSTSSFLTFSFWVKSSVAQNFYGYIIADDGTDQNYAFETGSLSADTWTKVTKTIPGFSNLQFDLDNGVGFKIHITPFLGTDYTDSGVSLHQWAVYSGTARTPDQTSTWYTTNNATFEITGVQLEVGSVATDFEHRSFADELLKCQRYFCKLTTRTDDNTILGQGMYYSDTQVRLPVRSFVEMRSTPTVETTNSTDHFQAYAKSTGVAFPTFDSSHQECPSGIVLGATIADNNHNGAAAYVIALYNASTGVGIVSLNAEL